MRWTHFARATPLCDITLRVENADFPAHRIVLAACSDYFCAMFTSEVKPKLNVWRTQCYQINICIFCTKHMTYVLILSRKTSESLQNFPKYLMFISKSLMACFLLSHLKISVVVALQLAEKGKSFVDIQGLTASTMEILLDFVYTETVLVTVENVQELLPAACLLQLKGGLWRSSLSQLLSEWAQGQGICRS